MSVVHQPDWVYKSHVFDRWLPKQKLSLELVICVWPHGQLRMSTHFCMHALAHTHSAQMITHRNFAQMNSPRVIWMWDITFWYFTNHHPSTLPFFVHFFIVAAVGGDDGDGAVCQCTLGQLFQMWINSTLWSYLV